MTHSEPLAPWRSPLSKALHKNRSQPFARYFQLATVRPNSTPANRTVVFRGFLQDTNSLMMISDRRSQKIAQIERNPSAEICWYFTKTREQFRLSGSLTLITADTANNNAAIAELVNARQQVWRNISDNARLQFAWPDPKAPRNAEDKDAFNPPPPDDKTPLDTFCLLLLNPVSVDYLSLRGEPQTRILYRQVCDQLDNDWQTTTVNP